MKKLQYIQPKVEAYVMPEEALLTMNASPTDGSQDPQSQNSVRKRGNLW